MTDTRHGGTARDDAIAAMTNPRIVGHGWPLRDTAEAMLDAIPTDVLQRLHDERLMAGERS